MNTVLEELSRLYAEVDHETDKLSVVHGDRLKCKLGCFQCCIDGLTVFEVEAENIKRTSGRSLRGSIPRPSGSCAFLSFEGACRIYPDRPYVCRTQGLPLRWLEERESEFVELRDICPLNEEGTPVETIAEAECWMIGPYESRLANLQSEAFGNLNRIPLRRLFEEVVEGGESG